jgi:hypothetical protein
MVEILQLKGIINTTDRSEGREQEQMSPAMNFEELKKGLNAAIK